jgi:hypothetical protein
MQGLAFVGVNVVTMLIYLPSLSCTPKPLLKVRPGLGSRLHLMRVCRA